MSIFRSEILRGKKAEGETEVEKVPLVKVLQMLIARAIAENKNTKCPIDAHCHRHCRGDPRIKGLHWFQQRTSSGLVSHMNFDNLRLPPGLHDQNEK